MAHILIREPEFLGTKQKRNRRGRQLLRDQAAAVFESPQRMFQSARAYGSCTDDHAAIGDGVGYRGIFAGVCQDLLRFHRGSGLAERHLVRIYQPEFGESEITHGARGGSDVQGIPRSDQHDAEGIHLTSRFTASSTPLMKATDSSPENCRASSSASSITTGAGVCNSLISNTARR